MMPSTDDPHATGSNTRARFTTHAPSLVDERVKGSALFRAHEELLKRVADWSSRLFAQYQAENASAGVGASQLASARTQVEVVSFHGINATPFEPVALDPAPPRKQHSPSRRHTQSAGEDVRTRSDFFQTSASLAPLRSAKGLRSPIAVITPVSPSPPASSTPAAAAVVESPSIAKGHPTVGTSEDAACNVTTAMPPSAFDGSTITLASTSTTRTPTTPPPLWLRDELDAFFEEHLANAIQARESELVNVMHDCLQQELQVRERHTVQERARAEELAAQAHEHEKLVHHLQSKLDRRIDENNALRKDYYKQLLMLRELVAKHRSDPRTMKALDEVIAAVTTGKYDASSAMSTGKPASWVEKPKTMPNKSTTESTSAGAASSMGMRREKEKWEQRAREAVAECQQLQEQLLLCKQQLEEARRLDGELWFASAQHGLFERQRIIDCVYKSKCTWDHVGESLLELLNNEMIWEAVEESAYKEKTRVSRGLEALLLRAESTRTNLRGDGGNGLMDPSDQLDIEATMEPNDGAKRTNARRRSAFAQATRLIMCRTCNGCGYLDATEAVNAAQGAGGRGETEEPEDDSYLRKTLAQVLELKASLEEANSRTSQVEQQLLRTVMEGAQIKDKLEKIEYTRAHGVDSGLQTDLDDEEEISLDDIMNAHTNEGESSGADSVFGRAKRGGRWKQYEHLIVELKSLLSERDAGIVQMKTTVADAQTRLVTVQRTSQQEQERLQRELQSLKGSLALAMSSRNEVIEEKQAAVQLMLKTMDRKKTQATVPPANFLVPPTEKLASSGENNEATNSDDSNSDDEEDGDDLDEFDDVKRAEKMARRYSDAISRVQLEYEEQQQRLKQAEEELGSESDKRKRTNSITMGNIVVTMSSHPRDIFKALSTTHQDLLSLRRSSQRASALQTDRLLTLTTHLAHISEELAMVKKRTCVEVDFWKLDCEKLQNANKTLAADLETARKHLEEANERISQGTSTAIKVCAMCDKHETRLLEISNQLLGERRPSNGINRSASEMSEAERNELCSILLDLESMYATLTAGKQQQAKTAITRALLGRDGGRESRSSIAPVSEGTLDPNDASSRRGDVSRQPVASRDRLPSTLFASAPVESGEGGIRSFQDSLFAGYPSRDEGNEWLLHGIAIDTNRPADRDISPSHRRKKVVRKVLTEQQVAQRKQARRTRDQRFMMAAAPEGLETDASVRAQTTTELAELRNGDGRREEDDDDDIASYIDESGTEVFYEDVEVEESEVVAGSEYQGATWLQAAVPQQRASSYAIIPNAGTAESSRRSEYSIQIPSPSSPVASSKLLATSSDIDKDPEVIAKLKQLVAHTSTARELLAVANWKILVAHFRASRDQRRLDFVNDHFRDRIASGKLRSIASSSTGSPPPRPLVIRTTMQKLVQYRELELDSAIRYRDSLRRESRRAQAHLIHGVSTVLTGLSRKNKPTITTSDPTQFVHLDADTIAARRQYSPSHSPQRPLYPSVKVNLSDVPETQQIPTPSFPFTRAAQPMNNDPQTTPPRASSPGTLGHSNITPRVAQTIEYFDAPTVSIFENDNRFPQRLVRFIPAGESDDLSLTHATSSIRFSSTSPSPSPAKSPSKAGLILDLRRRPTHSAGYVRPSHAQVDGASLSVDASCTEAGAGADPLTHPTLAVIRRPTRPQSSPAGSSNRTRTMHTAVSIEAPHELKSSDISPASTVQR